MSSLQRRRCGGQLPLRKCHHMPQHVDPDTLPSPSSPTSTSSLIDPPHISSPQRSTRSLLLDADMYRFYVLFVLRVSYLIIQLVYGYRVGSIALQAEALHNLSDVLALVFAGYSVFLLKQPITSAATFGWARMEVIGSLMNATFLAALCLSIISLAIQRIIQGLDQELVDNAILISIIASAGVVMNLIGLLMFTHDSAHGHSHASHGHSHSASAPASSSETEGAPRQLAMNIRAIIIHVTGDAIGSLAVIFSGLLMRYSSNYYRYLADPLSSIFITCIILLQCKPLLVQSVHILLQKVPQSINLSTLRQSILAVDGVLAVHDLHVWHLTREKLFGSCHVLCCQEASYQRVLDEIKMILHKTGVHSSCIQPEYLVQDEDSQMSGMSEATGLWEEKEEKGGMGGGSTSSLSSVSSVKIRDMERDEAWCVDPICDKGDVCMRSMVN